jgi:arylsulfatase A-like enzyme/Flp pilus assembly protein TadD
MKRRHTYLIGAVVILAIAAVLVYLLSGPGITGSKIDAKGMNLLVITLDTTRADRIGAYGYSAARTPNLDRLAADGVMFENCYSPVPLTLPSHCSIFTGRYPVGHRVRDNGSFFLDNGETTLAEKMKELPQSYDTFAVIASFVLMAKFGLNQGFDLYDDSLNSGELITNYDSEITAAAVYAKFSRWFTRQKEKDGHFFAWVHFYDPHTPYKPPAPFDKIFDETIQGRYNGEIAYMDSYVGRIVDDLKDAGVLEDTLILIAGDHGEAFGEHNEFGHSLFCYETNVRTPLVLYNTRLFQQGSRVSSRVSLVDIMPTLLELYGLEPPPGTHGESFAHLLAGAKQENERTFYLESMHGKEEMGWAPLTAIIDGHFKYISLPEPELYDLEKDKEEKENLFRKRNYLAKNLDKKLMKLVKNYSTPVTAGQSAAGSQRLLSGEDKKHLQSLGYISAFSGKSDTNLDPKTGILLKNRMNQIDQFIDEGHMEQAETELEKMAQENPKTLLPQYFGALNRIYKERKQTDAIITNWQNAIKTFPQNDNFRINLAFEYFQLDRLPEAEKIGLEILKKNDKYTRAYILLGKIRERGVFFEKASALEPQNVSLQLTYAKLLGENRDYKKAAAICDALSKDENIAADAGLKSRLGIVLTEIHKDAEAKKLLQEVKDAGEAGAETWNYLGILHFRKKEYKEARNAYLQSLEKDPRAAQTYNNMGTLYLTLFLQARARDPNLHGQALKAFDKALELNPNLASALNGRGSAYKFANRVQEALKDWKKAIAIKPSFIDVYFNIGVTYLQMNAKQEALTYLNMCKQKFYQQLPPAARQRLDRLISQAGG